MPFTPEEAKKRALEAGKRWRERNKEKKAASTAAWRATHPERYAAAQKVWFEANREYRNGYQREYLSQRRKTNPNYKLLCTLRTRLHRAVKDQGAKKGAKTRELIGCTTEFLSKRLSAMFKPGMTWENHGTVWEVDHITPCAAFDLADVVQQRKCFHYDNLQPLFSKENRDKGAKIISPPEAMLDTEVTK